MATYHPDRWVVLEFDYNGEIIKKVFAGRYGGFVDGDSWKLNSGITKVIDDVKTFTFEGYSGSSYICNKDSYGMSGYMSGIYSSWEKHIAESDGIVKMSVVPFEEI